MENRVYFKNLNALRFFAATAVIFHHIEQYKFWAGFPSQWGNPLIDGLGHKAVSFFFVLSGFLITYLLLEENRKTTRINVKNFYLRRILRIWPVYYLVVFLCLVALPNSIDLSFLRNDWFESDFTLKAILLILVLPNVVRMFSPNIVGGNQLWSIGVEEQFYLIWPILVKFFIRIFIQFLLFFILAKFLITVALEISAASVQSTIIIKLFRFWVMLKIEQMAIGAVGAFILFHRKAFLLELIFNRITWFTSIVLLIALLILNPAHWTISYAEGVIFLILLMNLSANNTVGVSMESPALNKLGNISYGIYMYHTLCITISLAVVRELPWAEENFILSNFFLYGSSILLTFAFAYFSYEYFEKIFLSLKEKFMIVKSGGDAIAEAPVTKLKKSVGD